MSDDIQAESFVKALWVRSNRSAFIFNVYLTAYKSQEDLEQDKGGVILTPRPISVTDSFYGVFEDAKKVTAELVGKACSGPWFDQVEPVLIAHRFENRNLAYVYCVKLQSTPKSPVTIFAVDPENYKNLR